MTVLAPPLTWTDVVAYDSLAPERGCAVLVCGAQVALFRTFDGEVYALSNYDPGGRAYVLSRGIVGTRGDVPVVASPLYKQAYDLRTGACLDNRALRTPAYPVRVSGGRVEVGCPSVELP
jgi:nitrite reductase (NADH) small subunit